MYKFYPFARPFLFALDPETAHALALEGLDRAVRLRIAQALAPRLPAANVTVMGITFPNRVGLAAGLDKNAAHLPGLATLGFGFLEVGTVTPRAQPGNAKPRMFRLPQSRALINRLGFNNDGVAALVANVARARYAGVLGINIGKNFDTPNERAGDDYVTCLRAVYPHAHYVTVNISSPNTQGLRDLQAEDALNALLVRLKREQAALATLHRRYVPLAVKIAPDLTDDALRGIARLLVAHRDRRRDRHQHDDRARRRGPASRTRRKRAGCRARRCANDRRRSCARWRTHLVARCRSSAWAASAAATTRARRSPPARRWCSSIRDSSIADRRSWPNASKR